MKLRIVSDLHFEFQRDRGESMTSRITDGDYDAIVIAGDLAPLSMLSESLRMVCRSAKGWPALFLPGNHEAYGASVAQVSALVRDESMRIGNLHSLDTECVTILNRRFIGATLWFLRENKHSSDRHMNDFFCISDAHTIGATAKCHAAYLSDNVHPGDIVVTHHLPHPKSIAPEYAGHELNRYFLHDVSSVVESAGAKLWIHGHTHVSCDYVVGTTRVVCNPLGYAEGGGAGEPNTRFDPVCTVEV